MAKKRRPFAFRRMQDGSIWRSATQSAKAEVMLRKLLLIAVVSVGSIGFLGSVQSYAENIKIGLPSVTITAMPFFVAKDFSFYQQEGLNAEMVVMPASLNVKVLLAG